MVNVGHQSVKKIQRILKLASCIENFVTVVTDMVSFPPPPEEHASSEVNRLVTAVADVSIREIFVVVPSRGPGVEVQAASLTVVAVVGRVWVMLVQDLLR